MKKADKEQGAVGTRTRESTSGPFELLNSCGICGCRCTINYSTLPASPRPAAAASAPHKPAARRAHDAERRVVGLG